MNTTVEKVSSAGKDDHLILFSRDAKSFDNSWFSPEETDFIKKELQDDKKIIVVNQYNRYVILQVLKNNGKERYHYLENCRKTGGQLCARLNAMKLKEVTIV